MLKRKDGFVTVIALILLLVVMPVMLVAIVDLPFWLTANRRLQNIVDNMAAGASTFLIDDSLAEGIIEFDEASAERALFVEMESWFELSTIPSLAEGGYTQLLLKPESNSYFQTNPIIIKMAPMNYVDLNNVPVGTPVIEYVIYNPKDSRLEKEFILSSGESIKLNRPTIVVSVMTKVYAPVSLLPVKMHKVAIQEVSIGNR